jgi:hypothetical protein
LNKEGKKVIMSRLKKVLIWMALLISMLACIIPNAATPPVPTVVEKDILTVIAETANAAQLQTASALPTMTRTVTQTRIPSKTPSPTPTFIYLLPTATLVPSYTPIPPVGQIAVGTLAPDERLTELPWTCLVLGSTPPRNVPQKPGRDFYVTWAVMNTGTNTWPNNGIDFVYESGYRTEQRQIQDLSRSVVTGDGIDLKILLTAPERPGTYNAIWALKVGQKTFCRMKIVFLVE